MSLLLYYNKLSLAVILLHCADISVTEERAVPLNVGFLCRSMPTGTVGHLFLDGIASNIDWISCNIATYSYLLLHDAAILINCGSMDDGMIMVAIIGRGLSGTFFGYSCLFVSDIDVMMVTSYGNKGVYF